LAEIKAGTVVGPDDVAAPAVPPVEAAVTEIGVDDLIADRGADWCQAAKVRSSGIGITGGAVPRSVAMAGKLWAVDRGKAQALAVGAAQGVTIRDGGDDAKG
jgi:hypothetical protein